MKKVLAQLRRSLVIAFLVVFPWKTMVAQESTQLPSQKTKDAVDKFGKAPPTIGKTLQGTGDTVNDKLRQAKRGKREPEGKPNAGELDSKGKKGEATPREHGGPQIGRDPFRPMNLRTKAPPRAKENLSPLERYELGQLKIVGIIWDIKEPRAMIEDTAGLGYSVKVGTPIGSNDGTVKSIGRSAIIVEEFYEDASGAKRKRDVNMRLATE